VRGRSRGRASCSVPWEGVARRVVTPREPVDARAIKSDVAYPLRGWFGHHPAQPYPSAGSTGIMPIDAMIPIGRGQRELIIGDRSTARRPLYRYIISRQFEQAPRPARQRLSTAVLYLLGSARSNPVSPRSSRLEKAGRCLHDCPARLLRFSGQSVSGPLRARDGEWFMESMDLIIYDISPNRGYRRSRCTETASA